jgi:hypothetical protein
MIRFTMPDPMTDRDDLILNLSEQFDVFMKSDALQGILDLLGCKASDLEDRFFTRKLPNGKVIEEQVVKPLDSLEAVRYELYPYMQELGMIDISEPLSKNYNRIVVLAGTINACYLRALYSVSRLHENVISVDATACYRPINPIERNKSEFTSNSDTEFGVMSDALAEVFGLDKSKYVEEFDSDRNLNSISCIRTFTDTVGNCTFRALAAPSTEPHIRRADSYDCLDFYLKTKNISPSDRILFISTNSYCNRQFVQLADKMISPDKLISFDIIGRLAGPDIATPDDYNPTHYINEVIGTIDWIQRFKSNYLQS